MLAHVPVNSSIITPNYITPNSILAPAPAPAPAPAHTPLLQTAPL